MRRSLSFLITAAILALIYLKIDMSELIAILQKSDKFWLCISILMVIPITALTIVRFRIIAPPDSRVSFTEGMRLILVGSTLNMVLPSKMGDIAKGYFMAKRRSVAPPLAYALVIYEKASDFLALLFWCLIGLAFGAEGIWYLLLFLLLSAMLAVGIAMLGSQTVATFAFRLFSKVLFDKFQPTLTKFEGTWKELVSYAMGGKKTTLRIAIASVSVWFLHLLQIWFFIIALRAHVPFLTSLMLSPLAILAGLLPITFAGVGTRDAALIALYLPFFDKPTGAALGILCTIRYIIPALCGLPFLRRFTSEIGILTKNLARQEI